MSVIHNVAWHPESCRRRPGAQGSEHRVTRPTVASLADMEMIAESDHVTWILASDWSWADMETGGGWQLMRATRSKIIYHG